jgi:Domain of unknown function (DUF4436)
MEEKTINKKNVVFIVVGILLFFVAFIYSFNIYKSESEKRSVFVEKAPEGKSDFIEIMAYIVSIDPIKGDMTVRLDFQPKGSLANEKGVLNEEVDLFVNSLTGKQEHTFLKGKTINALDVTLNLYDGLVTDYPFDKHKADLTVVTTSKQKHNKTEINSEGDEEIGVDNIVNFSGSVTGYKIDAELEKNTPDNTTELNIDIQRAGSAKFFSVLVMIIMWILILMLFLLVFDILVRGRKIEIAMFTFASAMLFAFPAFRNMMPLSPPIGAFPDYLAFFWAEGMAAVTLVILISTWFKRKT